MKYKLREIKSGIILAEFESPYDLAMTFLRYQEFYESANPKFKGKQFTIIEFMEWYSNHRLDSVGAFTYPTDWAGFNIPSHIIWDVKRLDILDENKYDVEMLNIWNKCNPKHVIAGFYLIGTLKGKPEVVKHEVAHGLYHVYPYYKSDMDKLYSKLPKDVKKIINAEFEKLGYHKSVWKDEAQAYLSTGGFTWTTAEIRKPFQELFKKFTKQIKWKSTK